VSLITVFAAPNCIAYLTMTRGDESNYQSLTIPRGQLHLLLIPFGLAYLGVILQFAISHLILIYDRYLITPLFLVVRLSFICRFSTRTDSILGCLCLASLSYSYSEPMQLQPRVIIFSWAARGWQPRQNCGMRVCPEIISEAALSMMVGGRS
jgi:hypothetical protein